MGKVSLLLLASITLHAHAVSMSSGELHVDGRTATFELHMPTYEIQHVANPETALLDHVRFSGAGIQAKMLSSTCAPDPSDPNTFICTAQYEFAQPIPDFVEIECTLFQVTVPNHVHLLHAVQGPNSDQVVFDQNFSKAEARFHPPSPAELIAHGIAAGIARLLASTSALLFLAALALAPRSPREAVLFLALFLAGEWIALPLAPRLPLSFSPAFLQAAMALTTAYLAIEILFLPDSRARWMPIPILGLVHGLYFAAFPSTYLAGASLVQLTIVIVLAAASLRFQHTPRLPRAPRPENASQSPQKTSPLRSQWPRIAAAVLLLLGIARFAQAMFY